MQQMATEHKQYCTDASPCRVRQDDSERWREQLHPCQSTPCVLSALPPTGSSMPASLAYSLAPRGHAYQRLGLQLPALAPLPRPGWPPAAGPGAAAAGG